MMRSCLLSHAHAFLSDRKAPPKPIPLAPPRFAQPKTDVDVRKAKQAAVCDKTQQDTKWCVNIWNLWREQRNPSNGIPPVIDAQNLEALPQWLSRFILEVRKRTGDPYPPETLYHIVCGLVRHIKIGRADVDFFNDKIFADCRTILDSEMKRLRKAGIKTKGLKAEPLSLDEEELLWKRGILGDHSPDALLNTVFFQIGINFALRSGAEHRALRHGENCQIVVVEQTGQRPYLQYTEDCSKNNQGGLQGRKIKPKKVIQHANTANPSRCPVRLFKLYNSLCSIDRQAFYLQPLKNPTKDRWYSIKALGHNTLRNMVQQMCKLAGITGHKTNHSLRATAATRLFHAGIDEQLIMERTGHRSIEGVRSYKRTSEEQVEELSDVLNMGPPPRKRQPFGTTSAAANAHQVTYFDFSGCTSCTINVQCGTECGNK